MSMHTWQGSAEVEVGSRLNAILDGGAKFLLENDLALPERRDSVNRLPSQRGDCPPAADSRALGYVVRDYQRQENGHWNGGSE
jgi:hypothetical protein